MNRKLKRIWRSATALCMAFVMMFSTCGTVFANDAMDEEVIHYVSLGASNTNGYGLDGYLPEEVHEDPLAASKANLNVYGYNRAPEAAYPAQVAKELETWTGKEVKLHQLAISSMRVEEVRYLLDDTMEPDDYMIWRFTGGEKWFEIAEAGGVEALRGAYRKSLTDADYVTLDLGWNNFGVFAFNYIKSILGGKIWPSEPGVPDVSDYIDEEGEAEYQKIKAMALEKLSANMDGADSSMKEKLDKVADVLACATMGACYNYDIVMEKIYELNPGATVVVINIQNLADDLVVNFEGTELLLGDLYGELIDFVNLYRASESPYADKCVFADAGDVTTFLDELVAWDGDPTTLSGDMEDCFDMYDDSLYVRSIIEYMMVGQALSGLFSGVRAEGASYGLDLFKKDNNYTYEFGLNRGLEELLALDLSKLNFANPGGADKDIEEYGAAVAKHLKNLRAKDLDAYDYVFENLLSSLQNSQISNIDQVEQVILGAKSEFKAKLEGVYKTYINTLDYAYDVVATIFREAAKINNLTVDADRMADFNDVADDLMMAIANNFIGSAQNKFYYELQINGVQETGVTEKPAVMVDDVLELIKEEPAVAAIAVLAVRYELGNSFFAHPNPAGHDEITDTIMDALKDGSHAGDFTDTKVSQYIEVLKNRYPNLYALVVGAEQVGEMDDLAIIISMLKASDNSALTGVDLDALEAGIRAAQRDYAESKTPEQQARAEEVAYDLMNRLYDLATIATGSDYKVTENSWYVSLGDSTISGYGLTGYEDGILNGAGQYVTGSAHVLLAQHLYGDAWRSHFNNLCRGALRADDLLLFLGGDVEKDDYYYQEIEPNLLEGSLAATQEEFISNVKKADLISVAIGGGNVFTFVGKQMNRVMGNDTREPLKLDWSRIGVDENDATMKELNELLDLLVPIIDEMGLMEQYVPEDMELENPAKFSRALVETLLYGYASYNYYYSQVLTKIKEINPDAQLLVLGMFNPVDDWTMSTTINGQKTFVNIGGGIGNVIDSANLQNLAFALQNSNTAFVDVSDAETIMEAENPGVTLTFKHYYDGSLKSNGKSVHASLDGHKYIFNQMADSLSVKRQALEALEIISDVVAEYYDEAYAYAYDYAEVEGHIAGAGAALDEASSALDELAAWVEANGEISGEYEATILAEIEDAKATIAALKDLIENADELDAETYEKAVALLDSLYPHFSNISQLLDTATTDLSAAAKAELEKLGNLVWEKYLAAKAYVKENLPIALEKAYEFIVEKAGDAFEVLADAAAQAVAEYGPEAVAWVYDYLLNNPAEVIAFFNEYGDDAVAFVEEYQNEIFAVLGFLVVTFGDDVADYVMEHPEEILKTMCEFVREYGDEAWALIVVYANELGLTEKAPTVEDIKNALDAVYNLLKEYGPGIYDWAESQGYIDALEAAVEALLAAVDGEIREYLENVKPEIEKAIEELKAELEALQAQLEALKAQLEDANAELKAEIEAAIEMIEAKIAEIEAAIEALEAKLAEIAAEINALYEAIVELAEAVQELIDISTGKLEADFNTAIEKIQNAYDKVVAAIEAAKELAETVGNLIAEAADMVEAIADQVAALKGAACEALEAMKAAIAAGAEALLEKYEEELAAIKAAIEAVGEEIWAEAQAQIEALQAKLAEEIAALQAKLAEEIAALKAQAEAQIEALKAAAEAQIAELKAKAEAEIAKIKAEVEAKIAELQAALENAAEEAKAEILAQIEALKAQAEAQIAQTQAALEAEIARIQAEVAAQIEAIKAEVEAKIAELTAAVEAQIAELTAAVEKQIAEIIAAAEAQNAELKAKAEEAAKEAIAAIEAAKKAVKAQAEALLEAVDAKVQEILDAVDAQILAAADALLDVAEKLAEVAIDFVEEKLDEVIAAWEKAYIGATTGEYTVSEDSYYVSIGDSAVTGLGLGRNEAPFGDRLAEALGLDTETQFAQLGLEGMRAEDLRYILDETYVPDAYGTAVVGDDAASLRSTYEAEIAKADLITVGIGSDNISLFVTAQLQRALAGRKLYDMDWNRYLGEAGTAYVMEELEGIRADLKESGLDDFTAGLVVTAVESYAYGYVGFAFNYTEALNRIHEINPEALVIVVGTFNPIDDMVIDVNGTEVAIGDLADGLVELSNLHFTIYAMLTPGTTFVTVPDTENFMDEAIAEGEYVDVTMMSYIMALLANEMHANANGHEYIKDRILNALTVNYDYPLGDVNLDGKVTAADVNLLYRYVGGLAELSELQKQIGDVNQDGVVTGADVNLLYRYVGGLASLN